MTARSLFDWLAELLGTSSQADLGKHLGIDPSIMTRAIHREGMNLSTLRKIHERTRVPIGVLAEKWLENQHGYRPPYAHERVHGFDAIQQSIRE